MKITHPKLLFITTCLISALLGLFFTSYNSRVEAVAGTLNVTGTTGTFLTPGGTWASDGKVGIGTTQPGGKLQIDTAAASSLNTLILSQSDTGYFAQDLLTAGRGIRIRKNGAPTTTYPALAVDTTAGIDGDLFNVKWNGNVGIGKTEPVRRFEVAADGNWNSSTFSGSGGTDKVVIGNYAGISAIGAHNSALNAWANLAINFGGGYVGIGTQSPVQTLTVGSPGSAGSAFYNIGANTMGVGSSLYSYGYICAGNSSGACTGSGGVVLSNAGTITAAGAITGGGELDITGGSGTSYTTAPIEVRTTLTPRISFHWPGVVASQLGMDSGGTIRTYDNPGTGYAAFAASTITGASGSFSGRVSATDFADASNQAYYLDPAGYSILNRITVNNDLYTIRASDATTGALFFGNGGHYLYLVAGAFHKTGGAGWTADSDQRVKTDVQPLGTGLKEVLQLEPKKYLLHTSKFEDNKLQVNPIGTPELGLIAQDVYKIIPEIVSKPKDDSKELWGLDYTLLTPVFVNAFKEQQTQIEDLKSQLSNQQQQIDELRNLINSQSE